MSRPEDRDAASLANWALDPKSPMKPSPMNDTPELKRLTLRRGTSARRRGALQVRRPERSLALFVPMFLGALTTILSFRAIESVQHQPFSEFVDANRAEIAFIGFGLLLFTAGVVWPRRRGKHPWTESRAVRWPSRRPAPWTRRRKVGAGLVVIGAVCFVISMIDTRKDPLYWDGPLWLAAACLTITIGFVLFENRRRGWFRDLGLRIHGRATRWWARDAPWLFVALGLWALALSYRLDTRPGFFLGDEATVIIYGRMTVAPAGGELFYSPWHTVFHPFASCLPRYFAHKLFPDRPYFGSRLFGVFIAAMTLGAVFFLLRSYFGRLAAWLGLVLLGSSHVFLGFARSGLTNLDAILLVCLWTIVLGAAWRTRRCSLGLLAGMLVGLSHVMYFGALVLLPLSLAAFAFQAIVHPRALWRRRGVWFALALGYGLASGPNHIYNLDHPNYASWRRENVYLLTPRNLELAYRGTGTKEIPQLLMKYSWPAIGGALLWPPTGQAGDYASHETPILDRNTGALFLLGLVWALASSRRRFIMALLLLWWALTMIFGSLLTTYAPYAPRIVLAMAAGYCLAAAVMADLVGRSSRALGARFGLAVLFAALGWTASIAYRNATHYWFEFAADLDNEGYFRFPIGLAEYLRTSIPADAHVIFYSSRAYEQLTYDGLKLFDTGFSRQGFTQALSIPAPMPDKRTAYIIRLPEFSSVEERLKQVFPRAEPIPIFNPYHPALPPTFHVYWIDAVQ